MPEDDERDEGEDERVVSERVEARTKGRIPEGGVRQEPEERDRERPRANEDEHGEDDGALGELSPGIEANDLGQTPGGEAEKDHAPGELLEGVHENGPVLSRRLEGGSACCR